MLVRTLGERIDLRLDLRPGLPATKLDPNHLEMALLNVLINARDALPAGGKVTVATSTIDADEHTGAQRLPPGKYVVICVIDEGGGMAPDVLQRATEPFFTTKGPGTGLGLAMVHGFVQQSHGVLEIESDPGKGTTVRMIFPALVAKEARGGAFGDGEKEEGALPAPTILVVDDNSDVLELAEITLEANGYCVVTADSAERAIERLAADKSIALVFSDIIMPGGMSGIERAGIIKDRFEEIPVVLTTGYTEELTGNNAARQLDILPKPYTNADLAKRISDALQRSAKNAAKA